MGALTSSFKKAVIDDILGGISSNTNYYYAFASNPVPTNLPAANVVTDSNNTLLIPDYQMLFGKLLTNNDILPMILETTWTSGTVYARYDNTDANLASKNYYVITTPTNIGGWHNIYMCLDNANGAPSVAQPDVIQPTSFKKQSDGYVWRYITSISDRDYQRFSTFNYVPVYANNTLALSASVYAGVDVVKVNSGGSGNYGYLTYSNGTIQSAPIPNILQVVSNSSPTTGFYNNCSIYIVNPLNNISELRTITNYYTNTTGNWVQLDQNANTNNIIPNITQYTISPKVVFDTDGDIDPLGYSVINPVGNTISQIVIINTGSNITRANVYIQNNYSNFDTTFVAANLQAIVPPPGGYGADPVSQLNVQGLGICFKFSNTENNTIPINMYYNKVGILKNPYCLTKIVGNTTSISDPGGNKSTYPWTNATFSQIISANISPSVTYSVGDTITGANSGSVGTIAFANSSVIYITGQKKFLPSEVITNQNKVTTTITINTDASNTYITGSIYTKDVQPLYIQNIDDVKRSNSQTENYKLIIQV